MDIEILQAAKIALHKHGDRHLLTLRVRCETETEAALLVNDSNQKGSVMTNEWKGKKTFWAQWRGRAAARLLHPAYQNLTGDQKLRAGYGIKYTTLIAQQWKNHGVGQRISEDQAGERQKLVAAFEQIGKPVVEE